MTKQFNKSVLH